MGARKGAVTRRQFLHDVATGPPGVLAQYLANTEVGSTAATDPMLALYAWLLLATKGQLPPESSSTLADAHTLTAKYTLTTTTNSATPTSTPTAGSRGIQAHDTDAKNRNGSEWYGADVNQVAVYTMLQQGSQGLTGNSVWIDGRIDPVSWAQPLRYKVSQSIARVPPARHGYVPVKSKERRCFKHRKTVSPCICTMPRGYTLATYMPLGCDQDGSVRGAVSCGGKYGWL